LKERLPEVSSIFRFSKIPFPAVTICPDLFTNSTKFNYNQIVNALKRNEIAIDNVTSRELMNYSVV
jgi:hypothetical protein